MIQYWPLLLLVFNFLIAVRISSVLMPEFSSSYNASVTEQLSSKSVVAYALRFLNSKLEDYNQGLERDVKQ
jgi:type II secretory pathway component PulF